MNRRGRLTTDALLPSSLQQLLPDGRAPALAHAGVWHARRWPCSARGRVPRGSRPDRHQRRGDIVLQGRPPREGHPRRRLEPAQGALGGHRPGPCRLLDGRGLYYQVHVVGRRLRVDVDPECVCRLWLRDKPPTDRPPSPVFVGKRSPETAGDINNGDEEDHQVADRTEGEAPTQLWAPVRRPSLTSPSDQVISRTGGC